MFIDLGLISRFNIDYSTLCRWLLTVKRNYRNETVQYHNWYHAFNVTQMMFCTLNKTKWNGFFTKVSSIMVGRTLHWANFCIFVCRLYASFATYAANFGGGNVVAPPPCPHLQPPWLGASRVSLTV